MRFFIAFGVAVMLLLPSSGWGKIGGGDIIFRPVGIGNVIYSHDQHVGKLGLKCKDCHYQIFVMSIQGNKTAKMEDMQAGKSCGACHNGKRAFSVKASCEKCHQ